MKLHESIFLTGNPLEKNPTLETNTRNHMKSLSEVDQKSQCVIYTELINGASIQRRLNFDSPRTKDALAKLGISCKDCIAK